MYKNKRFAYYEGNFRSELDFIPEMKFRSLLKEDIKTISNLIIENKEKISDDFIVKVAENTLITLETLEKSETNTSIKNKMESIGK